MEYLIYHPENQTYMFLRVYNFSKKEVTLKHDLKIAQIFFEKLTEEPKETYDKKKNI